MIDRRPRSDRNTKSNNEAPRHRLATAADGGRRRGREEEEGPWGRGWRRALRAAVRRRAPAHGQGGRRRCERHPTPHEVWTTRGGEQMGLFLFRCVALAAAAPANMRCESCRAASAAAPGPLHQAPLPCRPSSRHPPPRARRSAARPWPPSRRTSTGS